MDRNITDVAQYEGVDVITLFVCFSPVILAHITKNRIINLVALNKNLLQRFLKLSAGFTSWFRVFKRLFYEKVGVFFVALASPAWVLVRYKFLNGLVKCGLWAVEVLRLSYDIRLLRLLLKGKEVFVVH